MALRSEKNKKLYDGYAHVNIKNILRLLVFASILCIIVYGSYAYDRCKQLENSNDNPWSTSNIVGNGNSIDHNTEFYIKSFQINILNMMISFLVAIVTVLLITTLKD